MHGSSRGAPSGGAPPEAKPGRSEGRGSTYSGTELIYGRNPVFEALRGRRTVHTVLAATREHGRALERSLEEWCVGIPRSVPPVRNLSARELTALLGSADHQGVAAEVDPYPYVELEALLGNHSLVVALDGVQDPHNLGAIIRTAEATGAGVLIPRHRAADVTPTVVKASAGATEHTAVARVRNLPDSLKRAKEAGFWIYGAAVSADNVYTTQDYRYPTCLVVGSEGEGLGRRVASLCDVTIKLPLAGRVASLNVSVSTGILLYEVVRQRTEDGSLSGDS